MDDLSQEINFICLVYDKYIKKTEEIILFIQTVEGQKDFVEKVEVQPDCQEFVLRLKELSNSVVLYNAAVISIYGSYELFLDEILKQYTEYLKRKNSQYEHFPEKLRKKHIQKSAEFLSNPQRYLNLGLSNEMIIRALEASYVQNQSKVLLEELLISHGGNLNTDQLRSLLSEYGFDNPIQRLTKHSSFSKMCSSQRQGENRNDSFTILDQMVQERNKVGHGWIIDNRLAFSLLREEHIPFFRSLCGAIKDLVISQIIQDYIDDGRIVKFDPILDIWKDGSVIGINSKNIRLKVNEFLYCSTNDNWNYRFRIVNLQNDRKDRNEIRTANKDITIQADRPIKENYTIWGYQR